MTTSTIERHIPEMIESSTVGKTMGTRCVDRKITKCFYAAVKHITDNPPEVMVEAVATSLELGHTEFSYEIVRKCLAAAFQALLDEKEQS